MRLTHYTTMTRNRKSLRRPPTLRHEDGTRHRHERRHNTAASMFFVAIARCSRSSALTLQVWDVLR